MLALNNPWVLAASYLLHLVATVVWIGGLSTMALVVWPAMRRAIGDEATFGRVISAIETTFKPLSGLSLAVLIITGFIQMTANSNYKGFLNFGNLWAQVILLKHLSIIGMIVIGGVMNFGVQPELRRLAMLASEGVSTEADAAALRKRMDRLARINLGLGVLVLIFTAVARAQ